MSLETLPYIHQRLCHFFVTHPGVHCDDLQAEAFYTDLAVDVMGKFGYVFYDCETHIQLHRIIESEAKKVM